ncbi:MAG TPA: sialidase family protein [Puia sp.]
MKNILFSFLFLALSWQAFPQKTIVWDSSTLTRVSAPMGGYCGYARMIQLYDRSLLTIYEASGNIVCVRSKDLGRTWSIPDTIASKEEGVNMAVPDIVQLKDSSLIACYNPRPFKIDKRRHFEIRIKRSSDGGRTWGEEQTLYRAGYEFANGCWEPSAMQLPSGEIQLYFANEGPYTHSDEQEISLLRSYDNGHNWSRSPETVSFRSGKRDGMPVPVLLRNKREVAVAIEDNADGNFKPYILMNTLAQNWRQTVKGDDPGRRYALREKIAREIYAGAPFLRQLKSGETILSYQGTEGRPNKMEFAEMKVVIGDDQATGFSGKSVPFRVPLNKCGLWNSICVLDDDSIVALTSTNAFGGNTEVWMIRGRLGEK